MATSNARNVQLESEEPSALDQHPGLRQYFQEAHRDYQPLELEEDSEQQAGRNSQMVEQEQPEPELKPDPELAADQDRETFNERWTAEQQAARDELLSRLDRSAETAQEANANSKDQDWQNSL